MGYDLLSSEPNSVQTHATAFFLHEAFELVGGVDADVSQRKLFERNFNVPSYSRLELALRSVSIDVVVIAVPTVSHRSTIERVLRMTAPEAILCEKPLSFSRNDARFVVDICNKRKTKLFVNYVRRCGPGINIVRERIVCGEMRTPVEGIVRYTNGALNNGSHFVNLMEYWLGDVSGGELLTAGRRILESGDVEGDFLLRFGRGNVKFISGNNLEGWDNSVELQFQNGYLEYDKRQSEIIWKTLYRPSNQETQRAASQEIIKNDSGRYQWYVANELSNALDGRKSCICTGEGALTTLINITSVWGVNLD